jgi:hypothetical protein
MKLLEDKSFPETCGEAFFLFDFAEAYIISEQEEKALPLLERSVNIYMREVGIEHPFTKAVIERYHWLKKHIQSRKQFSSKQKKRPVKGRKRRH